MADSKQEHEDEHDYRDGSGTLETRVGALESGQSSLDGKVDQILGILSGGGKPEGSSPPENAAPGGDGIAMEIRKQLDERAAKQAADEEKASAAREVDALKQQVAALSEKRPEAPIRKVEKIMGWR